MQANEIHPRERMSSDVPLKQAVGTPTEVAARKAAIYARVSTADGRQDAENQLAELRRFAATQGWEIVGEYIDHESGGRADRVEFRRLFRDASQRRMDLVLFWALDRFTRDGTLATLKYLEQLESYGVHWRSFAESWIDSAGPFRDVVISLLATMAKQEPVRISERVRAGLNHAKAQGTRSGRPGGRPRVIFRRDQVVELRNQGKSWRQIARECGVGMTTVRRTFGSMPSGPVAPESCE